MRFPDNVLKLIQPTDSHNKYRRQPDHRFWKNCILKANLDHILGHLGHHFGHKSAILKLERGIKSLQIDFFDDQSTHDHLYVIYITYILPSVTRFAV